MRSRRGAFRTGRALAVTCLAGLVGTAWAQGGRAAVQARLGPVLAAVPAGTTVGLLAVDVQTGEAWCANAADTPLKPASVQKLLVTAAALERLGPEFAYETRVYVRDGDLCIVGAGDPALGDWRLADRSGRERDHLLDGWAGALRARGVETLGRIVLDDTIFEARGRHPDWPDDQADRWYQAPVGGLNYNDNCLEVEIAVRGGVITFTTEPAVPPRLIDNRLQAGKRQRPLLRRAVSSDTFELVGTVARGTALRPGAVRDPTVFLAYVVKLGLEQRGVAVRGAVVQQDTSAERFAPEMLLATHRTPLADVVWRCNRFSQNLFAECLLKTLAAYTPEGARSGRPGSWEAGRAVLVATLGELGVDLRGAVVRDGSGLSHDNRVTATQIVRLLQVMRRHRHADVFRGSLAEPGEEGSLRTRHNEPEFRGCMQAKTGTIAGVQALAGYLTRPDGTTLAFAVLVNGEANGKLITAICRALLAEG